MAELAGSQITNSKKINQLIEELVSEVGKINASVQEIRPPREEFKENGENLFKRTGEIRGRPLHYSFLGSGSGYGPYVELEDGSVKMDLINGIGIHLFGHAHPQIMTAAVRGALCDIVNQGNLEPNKEYTTFLEKIVSIASRQSRIKYGWLTTCGTMANENALKLVRQKKSPARMVLCFEKAFAGRSTMMAELTDNPSYKVGLPEYHEMLRIPFYNKKDSQSAEKSFRIMKEQFAKHEANICTFTFEPMQGEGGYNVAPREFFLPMLDFCKDKKIPIWLDEVQTFSRTGDFFAFETLNIGEYVDIVTIAKTVQVGCFLYTQEMNPKPGLVSGTFSGSSVALSAGIEILNMLDSQNYMGAEGKINQIHKKFIKMLNELNQSSCPGLLQDAEGLGLMIAVTPYNGEKDKVEQLTKRLFDKGIITFTCGKEPTRIRFLLPAILKDEDILVVKKILEVSLLES